jgi:hypothetical protein
LFLWALVIFASLYLLVADLVKNRAFFNIAPILSIVAFHLYGMAQAMQYIPVIWFLVFLNIGYAMTVNENVLPLWVRRYKPHFAIGLFVFVSIGVLMYALDFQSKSLAAQKELAIYSIDQQQNRYLGFYAREEWGEKGTYRWTGSGAIIKLPSGELFELTYVCSAHDLAADPVMVEVFDGEQQIDKLVFHHPQSITKQYLLPDAMEEEKQLRFSISRTWNLQKAGVAEDRRNLGVAISGPKVLETIPDNGIGFYHWEEWQGDPVSEKSAGPFKFRWTDKKAFFYPKQLEQENVVYLRAGQPGLAEKPLMVEIRQGGDVVREVILKDTDWHQVKVDFSEDLSQPYSIVVSRTWNPAQEGFGNDSRFLGVAVAGFVKAGE